MAVDSPEKREVVIKVEGDKSVNSSNNSSKIWRESSYDFWNDREKKEENGGGERESFDFMQQGRQDPPTKLIGQFMHKQKASGEISIDFEVMDELEHEQPSGDNVVSHTSTHALPTVSESPTTQRVSFESVKRRYSKSSSGFKDSPQKEVDGEVVSCTSNKSVERNVSVNKKYSGLMSKNKSRLLDQPSEKIELKSGKVVGKSGLLKSGFMGRTVEEEEDDPLLDEDLPDDFKKGKFSIWVLLEWTSLIMIIAALVCSLTIKKLRDKNLWKLKLWKWEVFVLVLICGRLVSSWIIRIVVFFVERNFLLRKRVLYFVYGLRKAVQNCLWLGLLLIAWHYLFDKKVEREIKSGVPRTVTKILVCLVVGVLLWLVKTLLVKVLASSFHVSTYFDRIQDSLFNQYVIETLSGPPLIELEKAEEEKERLESEVQKLENAGVTVPASLKPSALTSSPLNAKATGSGRLQKTPRGGKSPLISQTFSSKENDAITIDHLHKLNPKNVSAWNMKRLINLVRYGNLSTLADQIQDSSQEDESTTQIRSEYEAKAAATKIFKNVGRGSRYICKEHLMRFMPEEEALKAMNLFEGACEGEPENKKITKKVLKNWVVNAFRERRALALTLNDTKTAVNRLHRMVNILVGITIVIIWLLILGIATGKFLLFVSSQLVVVVFIFGNTCKTVFEAIIFLFVMHPFDVGDRCEIDGVQMVVEEMNILTTVFLRYDNQKIIFPNSVLATKPISNYYRSPDMGDAVEFCVHVSTPAEKISAMKEQILYYIEEKKKDHWYPAPLFVFKDVEELNRVRIAIWLTHKMNHQDMGERWVRRAQLVEELVRIFRELDIQYRLYPLDINVRAMPPVNSDCLSSNWTDLLTEPGDKQKRN